MKVTLASFAKKSIIPVWGTSNYVVHVPKYGTHKRTTITPITGGEHPISTPKHLKVDNLKQSAAKNLISKLKKHRQGSGVAVI